MFRLTHLRIYQFIDSILSLSYFVLLCLPALVEHKTASLGSSHLLVRAARAITDIFVAYSCVKLVALGWCGIAKKRSAVFEYVVAFVCIVAAV